MMDFFNWIAEGFSGVVDNVINALPSSPIQWLINSNELSEYVGMLNWFIPVYTFIGILENWLAAVVIYYVVQVILRWVKAIE